MAQAPKPGVGRRKAEEEAITQTLVLRIRGTEWRLNVGNIPLNERMICRQATGAPVEDFLTSFGLESIAVLWWLARRASGEPFLTWPKAMKEWEAGAPYSEDDFELFEEGAEPEGADDDPEG